MSALPEGFALRLSDSVRRHAGGQVLAGGTPYRLMRLSPAGVGALEALQAGRAASPAARELAGRLIDAGLAAPIPGEAVSPLEATVVIPVRDRLVGLQRCLRSLGTANAVVVDDGSAQAAPVRELCRRHGARHLRQAWSGGPAAARNAALAAVDTELIAFLDSDCAAPPDWLQRLGRHFADASVGAVAPRMVPGTTPAGPRGPRASVRERYAAGRSPLDLGPTPADVGPGRRIPYVPAAALVVRRGALGEGFDASLRYGEDVDLVWRLHAAGWTVRYDPAVAVTHREPTSWRALLLRRYRYGTSAGPLAQRHPGRLAPAIVRRRPAAAVALALAGRPGPALALGLSGPLAAARPMRSAGLPYSAIPALGVTAAWRTLLGLSRAATTLAGPALLVGLAHRHTRPAAAALLTAAPIADWIAVRPRLDPLRWVIASLADDLAYGAGVWHGCLRCRTTEPLRVRFARAAAEP